jgi:hypothetical protein
VTDNMAMIACRLVILCAWALRVVAAFSNEFCCYGGQLLLADPSLSLAPLAVFLKERNEQTEINSSRHARPVP